MQTLEILNSMVADRVIDMYAIGGAVAAYNYVEATMTEDLDILVSLDATEYRNPSGFINLQPIFAYLASKGYTEFRKEGLVIEGWPVQFLPVSNDLDREALSEADSIPISLNHGAPSVETRILQPEHVVATALQTGRPKDMTRIVQFIEENAVDRNRLGIVLDRHGLASRWNDLCDRLDLPGERFYRPSSPGPGD